MALIVLITGAILANNPLANPVGFVLQSEDIWEKSNYNSSAS